MKKTIKSIDASGFALAAEAFREFAKAVNELPEAVKQSLRSQ